jgi:hypothetical protein
VIITPSVDAHEARSVFLESTSRMLMVIMMILTISMLRIRETVAGEMPIPQCLGR